MLDYSGYTSSSSVHGTDDETYSDTESSSQVNHHSLPYTNGHSMTNGHVQYKKSEKSRSCETCLDSCGRKYSDELTNSSSSLIDLPISSVNHTDYDNLTNVNENHENNGQTTLTKTSISSGLDQKMKDAIDARLKEIDDEFELNCKKVEGKDIFISIISLDDIHVVSFDLFLIIFAVFSLLF